MTVQEALKKGTEILKEAHIEAPVVEAGVILCHALSCDRTYLYVHGDEPFGGGKADEYFCGVGRRAKGVPVQYITGHQEFMSLDFQVTPDVLIPRHDTEILVETVLEHVKELNKSRAGKEVCMLDMGTGSGCIAVSLAYYAQNCSITAVDISCSAIGVAETNAVKAGVEKRITFVHSDLFSGLEKLPPEKRIFDIIASNPPYIPTSDIGGLQTEVKEWEPPAALDGGTDGLVFYRNIIGKAAGYLKPKGLLIFEVGYHQAASVSMLMEKDFYGVESIKDIAGIQRVVKGFLK